MNAQQAALAAAQRNDACRQILLERSIPVIRSIGTQTAAPGTTSRFRVLNTGLLMRFLIDVAVSLTIGTANATASPKAPYNIINAINFSDFGNVKRINNVSGHHLWAINSRRGRCHYGANQGVGVVLTNPDTPVATGAVTVRFLIEVPIAFDHDNPTPAFRDLRGCVWSQSNVGEATLSIDWNGTLVTNGNANALYNGAATTTVVVNTAPGITCTVFQEYLSVNGGAVNYLPQLDLNTVYELSGGTISTDNIAVGTERFFPVPNYKRVLAMYFTYQQATSMTAGLMTRIRVQVNGNFDMLDLTDRAFVFRQRESLNWNDLVPGLYILDFSNRPVDTDVLANVQIGFTPGTVGATPNYESTWEAFYGLGSTQVGSPQSAGI